MFSTGIRWGVRAGQPLRIEQCNLAALNRYRLMDIQHAIGGVGDIDTQREGAGIRRVRRRGNGRRQRYRLWAARVLRIRRSG